MLFRSWLTALAMVTAWGSGACVCCGQSWGELGVGSASGGGISSNSTASECASLAFGTEGHPIVAWHDEGMRRVMVAAWDGTAWGLLGPGPLAPDGGTDAVSCWPSLACGVDGTPTIAWVEEAAPLAFRVHVRRWDGTAWRESGAGSATGDGVSGASGWALHPALAMDAAGQPVVAWQDDSTGPEEIRVRRWDGVSWSEVGAGSASGNGISATPAGRSLRPTVICGTGGRVVVAWVDDASGRPEIYLRQWSGGAWGELGGSASGGGVSNTASVRAEARPALALDAAGNPVVAWVNGVLGAGRVFARRWDGTAWVEIGTGSASGEGLGGHGGDANAVAMALAADGTPIVAWEAVPAAPARIYVRQWDGTAWTEVGAGSASGSGTSMAPRASRRPALAVDSVSGLTAIAWDGTLEHPNTEIYVRCLAVPEPFTYAVTFDLGVQGTRTGGGELVQQVAHGSAAVAPEFVVAPGWTFTGWSAQFATVTADLAVTAQYVAEAATWTVTFDLGGQGTHRGGGALVQEVVHGGSAISPEFAVAPGWVFAGWSAEFATVTTDLAVAARYEPATPVEPRGAFELTFGDLATPAGLHVFDLTGVYDADLGAYRLTSFALQHDERGTLSGVARLRGAMPGGSPVELPLTGKGRVRGQNGTVQASLTLSGRTGDANARLKLVLVRAGDALAGSCSGSVRTMAGDSDTLNCLCVLPLSADMDGRAGLGVLLDLDAGGAVAGSGTLSLANGRVVALVAKGRVNGAVTQMRFLGDRAAGPPFGAVKLRATARTMSDGTAAVQAIMGSAFGQSVTLP